jgi:hypothetical protein
LKFKNASSSTVCKFLFRMQRYMMLCFVPWALEHTTLSSCTAFAVPDVTEEGSESLLHSHCSHLHLLQLQLSKLRKGGPLHSLHWLNCRQRQRSQIPKWASPFPPLSHSSPATQRSQVSDRPELSSLSAHKCRTGRSFPASALTNVRTGRSSQASALTSAGQDVAL